MWNFREISKSPGLLYKIKEALTAPHFFIPPQSSLISYPHYYQISRYLIELHRTLKILSLLQRRRTLRQHPNSLPLSTYLTDRELKSTEISRFTLPLHEGNGSGTGVNINRATISQMEKNEYLGLHLDRRRLLCKYHIRLSYEHKF